MTITTHESTAEGRETVSRLAKLASIIVLNYNGEKIIGKCLDHLLDQTYPNFEIIVVDNGSGDRSLAVLADYLGSGRLSVIRSTKNLGVYGGRNLGLLYARGKIAAFMDDDGYADKNWLSEAVRMLQSDELIGAVASVVFFARHKIILNGAGATVNLHGYGGDLCYNVPYEFAELPEQVLYPMGCGMVVHKELMDRIGPFDSVPLRLYDDVELGIRLSKLGYKVVVAPKAWVDHDKGHSDQFLADRTYVSERERIRTVLKYYPALRLPSWLMRERHLLRYLKSPNLYAVPFKAWGWNVLHLFSALKWRARFLLKPNHFWSLVHPSWGDYPPPVVGNDAFRPSPKLWRERLLLDGFSDCKQLNFGWYYPERDGLVTYRWTGPQASAFFNFESAFRSCSLKLLVPLRAASGGRSSAPRGSRVDDDDSHPLRCLHLAE